MANISNAFGTITFLDKQWYLKNQKLIDTTLTDIAKDTAKNGYYGIDYIDKREDGQFDFEADGRWTFLSTLDSGLNPKWWNKSTSAMHDLYLKILKDQPEIEIEFTDEEAGCEVLYQETVIITTKNNKLVLNVTAEKDFDYTLPNLIKCGFYDGRQATPDNIKNFIKEYKLPKDKADQILQIIKDDPYLQGYIDDDNDNAYDHVIDALEELND